MHGEIKFITSIQLYQLGCDKTMKTTHSNKNELRGDLPSDFPSGEDHSLEETGAITTHSSPASPPQERKPHPRIVLLLSGLIVVLLAGLSIGGMNVRKAQYEKIDQARSTFFKEACHTETLPNSEALSGAKQNWMQAENLLQTIPSVPGLGFKDAQALKSSFSRCKLNIDANTHFQDADQTSKEARIAVAQVEGLLEDAWTGHLSQMKASIEHLDLINKVPQDLPVFADAQRRRQEYQSIRTQIQKRLDQQRQAVENFNRSKELYEQFQDKQVSSNTVSRNAAEKALGSAIGHLQTIRPGTTVSTSATETLRRYKQELADFKVEPVLQNLRQLAANFAQLSKVLQANLTFDANTSEILDNLARSVTQFQQEPAINNHPAMAQFKTALEDYQFAQRLWKNCNEQTPRSNLCFRDEIIFDRLYLGRTSSFHNHLVDYYGVTTMPFSGWISQKDALEKVFNHAQQNLEQANELIKN
jgi:hypothetical protein